MESKIKRLNRLRFPIILGLILLIYLTTLSLLPNKVFWAADEGAKFIQLQTLLNWQGGTRYQLVYPGQQLDPAYQFYPQHPIFPQPLPEGQVRFHWPIWFPLLSIIPFKLMGLWGLYIIPVASGLLIVRLSGRLAQRFIPAAAPMTMLTIGLASPIFIYSLLFWEHTLVVLLAMGALWQAMRLGETASRGRWWLALWLIIFYLAATTMLRLEMVVFSLALGLGLLITFLLRVQPRFPKRLTLQMAGLLVVLAIFGAGIFFISPLLNFFTNRGLLGPRYFRLLQTSLNFAQNPEFWRSLPSHLQATWLKASETAGPMGPDWLVGLGIIGLILGFGVVFMPKRGQLWFIWGGGLTLGTAALYLLLSPERYRLIHSFFLPSPYLAFLFLIIHYARHKRRFDSTLLASTTILYLIFGTIAVTLRQGGGITNLEWGTRYLLTLYPLAGICAVIGGWHLYHMINTAWSKRLLLGLGLLLFGIGIGYEVRGVQEIRMTKQDLLPYATALEVIAPRPIVTDLIWLPAVLAPYFVEQEIYILAERKALYTWLEQADGQVNRFIFAGFFLITPEFLELAPIPIEAQGSQLIYGITFTEYQIIESATGE